MDMVAESTHDFEIEAFSTTGTGKLFVLVIYDIIENKKRTKLAKMLNGFGFRIQKSAFEAMLSRPKYDKLIEKLRPFVSDSDSIRVYKIRGEGAITVMGRDDSVADEEVIII